MPKKNREGAMLKKDVNMTADGGDKLSINIINLLHLPHGCDCKPYTQLRSITSFVCGFSLMLFSQEPQLILFMFVHGTDYLTMFRSFFLKANDL